MIAALVLLALWGLTVGATCWFALNAPFGWEDEDGFHEGDEYSDPDNWGR